MVLNCLLCNGNLYTSFEIYYTNHAADIHSFQYPPTTIGTLRHYRYSSATTSNLQQPSVLFSNYQYPPIPSNTLQYSPVLPNTLQHSLALSELAISTSSPQPHLTSSQRSLSYHTFTGDMPYGIGQCISTRAKRFRRDVATLCRAMRPETLRRRWKAFKLHNRQKRSRKCLSALLGRENDANEQAEARRAVQEEVERDTVALRKIEELIFTAEGELVHSSMEKLEELFMALYEEEDCVEDWSVAEICDALHPLIQAWIGEREQAEWRQDQLRHDYFPSFY